MTETKKSICSFSHLDANGVACEDLDKITIALINDSRGESTVTKSLSLLGLLTIIEKCEGMCCEELLIAQNQTNILLGQLVALQSNNNGGEVGTKKDVETKDFHYTLSPSTVLQEIQGSDLENKKYNSFEVQNLTRFIDGFSLRSLKISIVTMDDVDGLETHYEIVLPGKKSTNYDLNGIVSLRVEAVLNYLDQSKSGKEASTFQTQSPDIDIPFIVCLHRAG